jgi:hypothetical protein
VFPFSARSRRRKIMAETRPSLPELGAGRRVSPEEIRDVLADEGYSAGARKTRLKTVLTELQEGDGAETAERRRLIEEINAVIDDSQDDAEDERRRPGDVM